MIGVNVGSGSPGVGVAGSTVLGSGVGVSSGVCEPGGVSEPGGV